MFDMESILNELSGVEKTIFQSYYVEGVPAREIATQFKARESWVHNKLSNSVIYTAFLFQSTASH